MIFNVVHLQNGQSFLTDQNILIVYSWHIAVNSHKIKFNSNENQLKHTKGEAIMKVTSLKYDFCIKEIMENEIVRKHFISDVLGIPLDEWHSLFNAETEHSYRA